MPSRWSDGSRDGVDFVLGYCHPSGEALLSRMSDFRSAVPNAGGMSVSVAAPTAGIAVRDAVIDDVATIREIYACHVRYGFASFEVVPPDEDEIERRRQEVLLQGLPYLVVE